MNANNSDDTAAILFNLGVKEEKLFVADDRPETEAVPDTFKMFTVEDFDKDTTLTATFYFSRINSEPLSYELRKYDAQLTWKIKSLPPRKQTFSLIPGVIITLREAFNLLQGRSVCKDLSTLTGEKHQAWIRLNLEKKDACDNYEMEYSRSFQAPALGRALANYPIQELQMEETALRLIQSLLMGNMELVNFIKGKKIEKVYIEANPQKETITINPVIQPMKKQERRRK